MTIRLTPNKAHRPDRQLVRTGHGALISVAMALKIASDANVIPIIFRGAQEIAAYGHTHRIASHDQRLALIARDKGCSTTLDRPQPGSRDATPPTSDALDCVNA